MAGSDISSLQCVLECDVEREKLMAEEKTILAMKDSSEYSDRLKKIYERLQMIDADEAESKASSILFGLGFDTAMQVSPRLL